jgi:hypothetical protein
MKQISTTLGSVALAVAALCATQAYAGPNPTPNAGQFAPNTNQYLTPATYIGIMDPTAVPGENASVQHTNISANSAFTDYWVFDVIPSGNAAASLSFNSFSQGAQFTSFSVSLYLDQAPISNLANAAFTCASQDRSVLGATACAQGPGTLTLLTTTDFNYGTPGFVGGSSAFTTSFLAAGRYVFVVTGAIGNANNGNPAYNGSIQVNQIPEPGTLALAGLALLGTAAAMRKRKLV